MTTKTSPIALQAKLAKAGSSLTIHAGRGKKLTGNERSQRMAARFDKLRKQAVKAGVWQAYCRAAKMPQATTGRDFFAE